MDEKTDFSSPRSLKILIWHHLKDLLGPGIRFLLTLWPTRSFSHVFFLLSNLKTRSRSSCFTPPLCCPSADKSNASFWGSLWGHADQVLS